VVAPRAKSPSTAGFFEEFRDNLKFHGFLKIIENHNFPIRVVPFLDTAMIC
jgi:hypothetical protein